MRLRFLGWRCTKPVTVYAIQETPSILGAYLFNWKLLPDFRKIPDVAAPTLCFAPVRDGEPVVPGVAALRRSRPTASSRKHYHLGIGADSLAFTGDTISQDHF